MWRRRRLGYLLLLTVVSSVVTKALERTDQWSDQEGCDFFSSELGPDWYKLERLLPYHQAKKKDDPSNWLHMPCATGTVFDVAVCGCTNIVSYLFTSFEQRSSSKHTVRSPVIFDEGITAEIERPATLLLNTETGEVKACPFKASETDRHKYMVKVPGARWQEMACAVGTVFAKEVCTCIHEEGYKRSRKDSSKILVLDHHDSSTDKDTISKSLEISSESVWFNPEDIPFHRRQENENKRIKGNTVIIKPDVQVSVVNHHEGGLSEPDPVGKERLPQTHTPERVRTSPLSLDAVKMEEIPHDKKQDNIPLVFDPVGVKSDKTLSVPGDKNTVGTILVTGSKEVKNKNRKFSVKETHRQFSEKHPVGDKNIDGRLPERQPTLADLKLSLAESNPDSKFLNPNVDWISLKSAKKLLREKSPEAGEAFMKELEKLLGATRVQEKSKPLDPNSLLEGRIIYTGGPIRKGSYPDILDNTLSLGNQTKDSIHQKDEVHFPLPECHKRPAAGHDEQHFQIFLWGLGWVTYRCHSDRIYDDRHCACLSPDHIIKSIL